MAKTVAATVDSSRDSEVEREHQVLYRKFRPRQFADVVGQDHIIKPLQRKVAERKIGHAYLFVGPRGCGKTTTARLLAAASNCPSVSAAGEPCGDCSTCNGIINGSGAIGLHELDAASNRGVGDMLDLINTMGQGSVARKKVYIVDEALALDTPIPTPTGWTTMGSLVSGDFVLGTGGYPVKVVRTTEVAEDRPCYIVTFSDGTSVTADENHKWMVEPRRGTYGNNVDPARVMTTGEMFSRKNGHRFRLPKVNAIDLPEVDLPVDPYVLGRWLGDGTTGQPHITAKTSQLEPLVSEMLIAGENASIIAHGNRKADASRVSLSGGEGELFAHRMEALGVYRDKHIPAIYLRSSLKQRLSLLQGLMDSDGHINGEGTCTFINTNKTLVTGTMELLRSLGYHPRANVREDNREGGVNGGYKDVWKVNFRSNPDLMPFRTRDTEKVSIPSKELRKSIVSITPTKSVPVRCIEVDAEDHLFLAGEGMAVTHNCHMLTKEASNALLKTLEEPPADTLIILATTEANKVLSTIQSRAVRYNFKTVDANLMTGLVKEVVEATGMDIDAEGIAEVVRRGHGSPRDTLTALEGYGGEEAGDDVRSFIPGIAAALAERSSSALIISIAEAIGSGVDVPDLTRSLLEHWRNCLLALEAPAALDLDRKTVDSLAKQAKALKPNRVVRLLNLTSEALGKMTSSGDARLLLETTLLQISQPSASDSLDGIYDRLDEIQDALDDLATKGIAVSSGAPAQDTSWPPAEVEKPKEKESAVVPEPVESSAPDQNSGENSGEDDTVEAEESSSDEDISDEEAGEGDGEDEVQDYDQWEDEMTDSESVDDSDNDSEDRDDEDDERDGDEDDDKPTASISDLYDDEDDVPDSDTSDDDQENDGEIEHSHDDADEDSGFLDCKHPSCVSKYNQMKKVEKEAERPSKDKKGSRKEEAPLQMIEEKEAPTARELVEAIQFKLIDKKFSRYLQDTVMDFDLEEEKDKVYLVLTLRKDSKRVPTKEAVDAIMDCKKNLWVDGIDYFGEER